MNRSRLLWLLSAALLAATAAYAASPDFDSVLFRGATSGTATVTPQATAGTPTITLPTTSGTLPTTASAPLVLNATTGALSCPTCGTGSGSVSGPGSSTAGHVATWDNTSGTILADGGALATVATSGSAADLGSGTLAAARLPTITSQMCATWDSTLAVTAQTIEFPIPWATYTVASMKSAVTGGGSFAVTAKIAGTDITSLSAVSVSGTTNTSTTATGANTGVANDQITLVISSPSGTVNQAYVCLVITHSVN